VIRGDTAFPPDPVDAAGLPVLPPSDVGPVAVGVTDAAPQAKGTGVIGADDRVRVHPIVYPYSCVCRLDVRYGTAAVGRGTGWLLTPTLVLTAGHVLYNRRPDLPFGWATAARVTFGFSTTAAPAAAPFDVGRPNFVVTGSWAAFGAPEFDFAAIRLASPLTAVGTLGVSAQVSGAVQPGTAVEVPGYPRVVRGQVAHDLFTGVAPVADHNGVVLRYRVDTGDGQSGAPVTVRDAAGAPFAVGIHNYGDPGGVANQATWLVGGSYQTVVNWANGVFH
jgi:V8-like Glu-specific endopeptidase